MAEPEYLRKLASLRRRIRGMLAFQGLVYLLLTLLTVVLVDLGLDRLFRLDMTQRLLLDGVVLVALGVVAVRHLFGPMAIPLTDEGVAVLAEHRFPELGDRLISALQFQRMIAAGNPISPALAAQVERQATALAQELPLSRLIDTRRLGQLALLLAVVLGAGGTAGALIPAQTWRTWFERNLMFSDVEWPYRSRVDLLGFDDQQQAKVALGEAFVLHVAARTERPDGTRYEVPERIELSYRIGNDPWKTIEKKASQPGKYHYPFPRLQRTVELTVRAGDFVSRPHRVQIAKPPELGGARVEVTPPAYTTPPGTPPTPTTFRTDAAIEVLGGSQVVLRGTASGPLGAVRVTRTTSDGVERTISSVTRSDRTLAITLPAAGPEDSGTIRVELDDPEGIPNRDAVEFELTVSDDQLPRIIAQRRDIGESITQWARVPHEVEVTDDHGMGALTLVYQLRRRGGQVVHGELKLKTFARPGSRSSGPTIWVLDLEKEFEQRRMAEPSLKLPAPGDKLVIWFAATDYADGGGRRIQAPRHGSNFRIVDATLLQRKLLAAQKKIRQQFAGLIDRQRQLQWVLLNLKNQAEWKIDKGIAESLDQQGTQQRRIQQATLKLANGMTAIRELMKNNRLDRKGEQTERLEKAVIQPMGSLAHGPMSQLASRLEELSTRQGEKPVAELDDAIGRSDAILREMARILKEMVWSEYFDDVVTRLRTILRLQEALRRLTQEAHRKRVEGSLEDILGPPIDEPKKDPKKPDDPKKPGGGDGD